LKKGRNQWHPGYCGAIELGLRADREYLEFDKEHLLNSAPLKMDLFIVKKKSNIVTHNSIGKIFRRYNIIEFKSPDDALNYDTYIKVVAYACLYKASEKHVGEVSMKDITLTFLRSRVPRKLFRELESEGYRLTYPYPGIYYLQREGFLPMQVIIPDRLEDADSIWLKSLTNRIEQDTLKLMVAATRELRDKGDMDNADAVIQVSAKANPRV
jgi:hypothetical protein